MTNGLCSKSSITFLCKNLSSFDTAQCAVLMNYLRSEGHPVNLITEELHKGDEFRFDSTIRTFSIDTPVRFSRTRNDILADFANVCENSIFILFSSSLYLYDDVTTLIKAGKTVVIFEDIPILSFLYNGKASLYKKSLDAFLLASAIIAQSHSAYAHLKECDIKNAFFIPYIFPFTDGEFPENIDNNNIALIYKDNSLSKEDVQSIFTFVKNECPDSKIFVKGLNDSNYNADDRIYFVNDINLKNISKALLFYGIPYIDKTATELSARKIPYTFFSHFFDKSLSAETLNCLKMPLESTVFTVEVQQNLLKKLSVFFESFNTGIDENILLSPDYKSSELTEIINKLQSEYNDSLNCAQIKTTSSTLKKFLSLPKDYLLYLDSKRYTKYKIHQTSPETVEKCQILSLYLLDELERICKKHSLRYYIAAGSLLGAVRHGGIIPWDDDIDVTMPRPDYEALLKIAQKELPDNMVIPKDNFPYAFTRIMLKGTTVNRRLKQKGPHGVFVDIFPLDGAAPDEKSAKRQAKECKILLRMMHVKMLPFPRIKFNLKCAVDFTLRLILKCIPKSCMKFCLKKICRRYSTEDSASWVCLPGSYSYEKESFPKEYWGEPVMMMYNGTMRPVMKEWEKYLTLHYGDYMRTPPLLYRRTHGSLSIDLGMYENMSIDELKKHLNK